MIDIYRFNRYITTKATKLDVCVWIMDNLYPSEKYETVKGEWDTKRHIDEDYIINYAKTKGYTFKSNF